MAKMAEICIEKGFLLDSPIFLKIHMKQVHTCIEWIKYVMPAQKGTKFRRFRSIRKTPLIERLRDFLHSGIEIIILRILRLLLVNVFLKKG